MGDAVNPPEVPRRDLNLIEAGLKGYGMPERVLNLEEVERPSVGDDDALIRVRATSVNTRTGSQWLESLTCSG